jgi:lipoprotein
MKKIFFALAIIASITACTKSEAQSPEPEPVPDTTSKSYVGCMRSDYPDIAIPGISVNDKIIYDLKSACTYSSPLFPGDVVTYLYSGEFTLYDIVDYDIFPIAEIDGEDESNIYISISEKTFDNDEIIYDLRDGEVFSKTENIKSVHIKEAEVILDNEYFKTDICKFDIEINLRYGKTIAIVYYGESIHQSIKGGIK